MSHVCLLNALGLQVATRLPQCGGVMFSFKTYIRPLKALEQRTAVMQRLLAACEAPAWTCSVSDNEVRTSLLTGNTTQQILKQHAKSAMSCIDSNTADRDCLLNSQDIRNTAQKLAQLTWKLQTMRLSALVLSAAFMNDQTVCSCTKKSAQHSRSQLPLSQQLLTASQVLLRQMTALWHEIIRHPEEHDLLCIYRAILCRAIRQLPCTSRRTRVAEV